MQATARRSRYGYVPGIYIPGCYLVYARRCFRSRYDALAFAVLEIDRAHEAGFIGWEK